YSCRTYVPYDPSHSLSFPTRRSSDLTGPKFQIADRRYFKKSFFRYSPRRAERGEERKTIVFTKFGRAIEPTGCRKDIFVSNVIVDTAEVGVWSPSVVAGTQTTAYVTY